MENTDSRSRRDWDPRPKIGRLVGYSIAADLEDIKSELE